MRRKEEERKKNSIRILSHHRPEGKEVRKEEGGVDTTLIAGHLDEAGRRGKGETWGGVEVEKGGKGGKNKGKNCGSLISSIPTPQAGAVGGGKGEKQGKWAF